MTENPEAADLAAILKEQGEQGDGCCPLPPIEPTRSDEFRVGTPGITLK